MGTTPAADLAPATGAAQLADEYEAKLAALREKLAEQYDEIATRATSAAETIRTSNYWLTQGHTVRNLATDVTDLGETLAEAGAIADVLDALDRLTGASTNVPADAAN